MWHARRSVNGSPLRLPCVRAINDLSSDPQTERR
jgi:hypothetical protein